MSGVLSTPEDMLADRCDKIPVAIDAQASLGTEDIVVDRETGLVMVSAMNRFDRFARNQNPVDGIYGFVIDQEGNSQAKELRLLSLDAPAEFHPHGIDFWQGINKDGSVEKRLFVVNHINDVDKAVEVFRINTDLNLTHLYSVTSSEIYSPNDLAAVGPDQFYISNDHGRGQGLARMVEQYLFFTEKQCGFSMMAKKQKSLQGALFMPMVWRQAPTNKRSMLRTLQYKKLLRSRATRIILSISRPPII